MKILLLCFAMLFAAGVYAAPADPADPQVQRLLGPATGVIPTTVEWPENPVADVNSSGFQYAVFFGPLPDASMAVYKYGLFSLNGGLRSVTIPDVVCELGLDRVPQQLCFGVKAANDAGVSDLATSATLSCLQLTATDAAGVCTPKPPTVTINPAAPAP